MKTYECLFCFQKFNINNLIKLKCNCSNYYYCYKCLYLWEEKFSKVCPCSWCKKPYYEEYFSFKKYFVFFKIIIFNIFKIFIFTIFFKFIFNFIEKIFVFNIDLHY